jgi:hypothetical protein
MLRKINFYQFLTLGRKYDFEKETLFAVEIPFLVMTEDSMLNAQQNLSYVNCLLVVLVLILITFVKAIYDYIPGTNHVSRVYSFTTILWSRYMVHVIFPMIKCSGLFYISIF